MDKSSFVSSVAAKSGLSKSDAEKAVRAFTDAVSDLLSQGDSLSLPGFGVFQVRQRAARQGRNPQTGETIQIAAATVPAFKPSKNLKEKVNR